MQLDQAPVAQMDASVMDYWGAYALADGGRHERSGKSLFMQTAIPHFLFNSVILTAYDAAEIERALALATDVVATRGVPVFWRVGPMADCPELSARLQKAGLVATDEQPAMLTDLPGVSAEPDIDGLEIVTASDPDERRAWGRLAIRCFEMEDGIGVAMGDCEASIPAALFDDHLRFTALLDGEPVAVSSLVMTEGLAGVYAVATLPEARRRGIGSVMTLHAMEAGRRRGATKATLQATPMGKPVYEKLGFETVFHYKTYLQS